VNGGRRTDIRSSTCKCIQVEEACAKQRNDAATKNAPKMLATFGRGPPIPSRFIGGSVRHYSKHFNGFAAKN